MFVETVEAVSAGISTFEIAEKVTPTFNKIFKLLKNGELKIVILGAGGTGKSTLGKLLAGDLKSIDLMPYYQESISTEKYDLKSNVFGSVIVLPGQERRQDEWHETLRFVASGKVSLIIHIVSWGYHSFGEISYTKHESYQSGMTPQQFVEDYAMNCREKELNILKKIEPFLAIADQKKTILITLVTKQDLWWNHRNQVSDHYKNGDYQSLIQNICSKRGSVNFRHECLSTSLIMENLVSGNNELLVPTTEGYDQRLKLANLKKFFATIETLFKINLNAQGG